jgi:hypothetical protein
LLLLGYAWARTWRIAVNKKGDFYRSKLEVAQYYFDYLLPEAELRLSLVDRAASIPFVRERRP